MVPELQGNLFQIHRRDRDGSVRGSGVMLAVRHPLISIRRPDFETNAELLVCEIKPVNRMKFLHVLSFIRELNI